VLNARAQYLINGAELDDGSLADINWIEPGKQYFPTYSLKYSDDIM
jgi:Zn-dependent M32 family carboxypeptidase